MGRLRLLLAVLLLTCWLHGAGGSGLAIAAEHLASPVAGGEIVLGYGSSYTDSASRSCVHRGVDIRGHPGDDVCAAAGGIVRFAGRIPADGGGTTLAVTIRTADGRDVTVSPLSAVVVAAGEAVEPRARLGALAETGDGSSAEPHVHLSARRDGVYIDPGPLEVLGVPMATPPGDVPEVPEASPPCPRPEEQLGMQPGVSVAPVSQAAPAARPGLAAVPFAVEMPAVSNRTIEAAERETQPGARSVPAGEPASLGEASVVRTHASENPTGRQADAGRRGRPYPSLALTAASGRGFATLACALALPAAALLRRRFAAVRS